MVMRSFAIFTLLLLLASIAAAADVVFPAGTALDCQYEVDELNPRLGDTVAITRSIVNNDAFPVSGLYICDNLPQSFEINSAQISINSAVISPGFEADPPGSIVNGFVQYRWIIDDPIGGTVNFILNPGDSLHMVLELVCTEAGDYTLEQHGIVAFGNGAALFSIPDQPIDMTVSIVTNVLDDAERPESYLLALAYPNPFNGGTTIAYEVSPSAKVRIEIYDLLGRCLYDETIKINKQNGAISWDANNAGSGVYFYRLTAGQHSTGGKLVLLK